MPRITRMDSIAVAPERRRFDQAPRWPTNFSPAVSPHSRLACQWVKDLPYGSNSSLDTALILFEEGRGTCFTKHGVIARLADELGLEVHKNLGFYRLTEDIITGASAILQPSGLEFVPSIHCFLEHGHLPRRSDRGQPHRQEQGPRRVRLRRARRTGIVARPISSATTPITLPTTRPSSPGSRRSAWTPSASWFGPAMSRPPAGARSAPSAPA